MNNFFQDHINISKIIYAGYFIPSACERKHTNRKQHTLSLLLEGEQIFTFHDDNQKIHLYKGDIIYLPKGSSYHTDYTENSKHVSISFALHDDDVVSYSTFSFSILNDAHIISKFHQFVKVLLDKQLGYMNHLYKILYGIIYDLQTKIASQYLSPSQRQILEKATELIDENLDSPQLSVASISESLSITPEYFRYIFKKKFNLSPKKYIINKRINLSLSLLTSSTCSIQKIAEQCGFNDATHFSTEFKKIISYTPSEYRKILFF